jgi:hypothetical protein
MKRVLRSVSWTPPKHKSCYVALLFLELNNRIGQDVTHVDLFPTSFHLRVFLHHQPSDVREEQSAARVVRVGICLAVLVVDPVVSDPLEEWVLWKYVYKIKLDVRRCIKLARASVLLCERVLAMSYKWRNVLCAGTVLSVSSNNGLLIGKKSSLYHLIQFNFQTWHIQGDKKMSVHLIITTQKVTSNVQSAPLPVSGHLLTRRTVF